MSVERWYEFALLVVMIGAALMIAYSRGVLRGLQMGKKILEDYVAAEKKERDTLIREMTAKIERDLRGPR